jgi:hypothetical protein
VCLFGHIGHPCFLLRVTFYFLLLCLRLMGQVLKADWSTTFFVTSIFIMPISSGEASYDLLHFALASNLHFCAVLSYYFCFVHCYSCMVRIKFTACLGVPLSPLRLIQWLRMKRPRPSRSRERPRQSDMRNFWWTSRGKL